MSLDPMAIVHICGELHVWEAGGAASPEKLTAWVDQRLKTHEAALEALLAIDRPHTPENTLRLYDVVVEQLSLAGAQAGIESSTTALVPARTT